MATINKRISPTRTHGAVPPGWTEDKPGAVGPGVSGTSIRTTPGAVDPIVGVGGSESVQ
jgi:hypothetical protein